MSAVGGWSWIVSSTNTESISASERRDIWAPVKSFGLQITFATGRPIDDGRRNSYTRPSELYLPQV